MFQEPVAEPNLSRAWGEVLASSGAGPSRLACDAPNHHGGGKATRVRNRFLPQPRRQGVYFYVRGTKHTQRFGVRQNRSH